MTEEDKMKKAIRKVFEAMQGQAGEMKSDFEKYQLLVHVVISNLGEFRGEDAEVAESVVGSPEQRKTGWDFGATLKRPDVGSLYFTTLYDEAPPNEIQTPACITWDNLPCEEKWIKSGRVFESWQHCKAYCDYLNSLQSKPK